VLSSGEAADLIRVPVRTVRQELTEADPGEVIGPARYERKRVAATDTLHNGS
jgi:hypothetical protein